MGMSKEDIEARIKSVLKFIADPEIPINVIDLGLIRELKIEDRKVRIKMVMTAPGCPYASVIVNQIRDSIRAAVPEVEEVDVQVINFPPWTPKDMTEEGREQFKKMYGYDLLESFLQRYGSIENYYEMVKRYLGMSQGEDKQ